ncbi:cytochrome-ba3 oxidase subunit [Halorussus litoreus]|uniref:cytochrome-ba3 oxidase subunit n=1 Tax=Halorussus litoreus TaxID=1710536 RepID=UPI001E473B23|nr:cytochrome-ba3 oxidase subunit [Halorussus litoreus]
MLALLALVPAVAFGLGKNLSAAAVTAVNVVLIFTSIYLLVSPVEGDDGHETDGGHETDDATDSAV